MLIIDIALVSSRTEHKTPESMCNILNRVFISPKNTTMPKINIRISNDLLIELDRQSIKESLFFTRAQFIGVSL